MRRRLRREPHRLLYFHQVDDPYSHLVSQVLGRVLERYRVVLEPFLVGPPTAEAAPERGLLEAYARKDAADVAAGYQLTFPAGAPSPAPALVGLAQRTLAGAIASGAFVEWATPVGDALWAGDEARLASLAHAVPALGEAEAAAALRNGQEVRARRGHYLGAMLHYGGGWYWGVDRLGHLEERWHSLGIARPGRDRTPIVVRPDYHGRDDEVQSATRLRVEFYASLRSPYTYIAMGRVHDWARRLPVDVVERPVLPMVMRGLPVPRAKRLYILLDTKREAEAAGVDFGRVCDPVGRPIERAFSLYPLAQRRGVVAEYLESFARAAFAEGIDTGEEAGLRLVCERVGIDWGEAQQELDQPGWEPELEANRAQMFASGLWGVPSFRLVGDARSPDFCTWGQDRLWRVEEEIRRRLGAPTR
jgi:2-hydroxychromene-2-carboxylate isomerase